MALGLLAGCFILTGQLRDFRGEDAFDFASMKPGDLLVDFALTRRQIGLLGFGYVEKSGFRPEVGAFGNHQIQLFSSESFGREPGSGYFFNYWYANLGLPELRDELYYLATRDLLPRSLVVVQITTPNNDNGANIIEYGSELPPDVREAARVRFPADGEGFRWDVAERLGWRFSYRNLVRALTTGSRYWLVDPADCPGRRHVEPSPAWVARLPRGARQLLGYYPEGIVCQRLAWSLRRDGSGHPQRVAAVRGGLRQNARSLDRTRSRLNYGDEPRIARYLREIDGIGREAGVRVVFAIIPVYETADRSDSYVNQIVDRALELAPQVSIVDHRRLYLEDRFFSHYDHPNLLYYRDVLAPQLCEHHLDGC